MPVAVGAGLEAWQVSAFRGERLVLRGVSFTVPPGGALLLLGPNGSGKSTLLRVLAGLKQPDAGSVLWMGQAEAPVAYLGHQDAIKPGLTAAENLGFAARTGQGTPWGALAALDLLALADLPARLLSAGQKRRLALARLVLSPAPVWLLDEPTLGLDAAAVERLGGLLAAHRAGGGVAGSGGVMISKAGGQPIPARHCGPLAAWHSRGRQHRSSGAWTPAPPRSWR